MHATNDELRASPRLALYLRDIEEILRTERPLRERFRDELDETKKAEFINGEVFVHSPAKEVHNGIVTRLITLLNSFVSARSLGVVRGEKALVGLTRNDYEPDVCYFSSGKAKALLSDTMVYPSPDFIVEVLSPSTAKNDRGVKFEDYAAHGVAEYWIVDPAAQTIEQYVLRDGQYQLEQKTSDGTIRSATIAGFAMPAGAAFDDATNLAAVRQALK